MADLVSKDRIKYLRMWAVYIADMVNLESEDPEVWNSIMEGNFSCHIVVINWYTWNSNWSRSCWGTGKQDSKDKRRIDWHYL